MEENKDIKIASFQDVKDMFTLETTLNALLDRYEETYKMLQESNKISAKLSEQLMKLIEENTALMEANKELTKKVESLCEKAELVDANAKLKKDNTQFVKDNKALMKKIEEMKTKTIPVEEIKEESIEEKAEKETKAEEPIEVKTTGDKVKPGEIKQKRAASNQVVDDAKKIVARYSTGAFLKKKLCRKDDLKSDFKERKYLYKVYDYLKEVGFVNDAGLILTRDVKFDR